ncbi:MAG: restriction endonuclease [Gammaproteobacteria bacterium]|jgi:hypothetical protein|nr:restriction endonuclease [Gammaproteobacteria bacterium]
MFSKLPARPCVPSADIVHLGKHSGDDGVDIKLVMSDTSSVLVQVKRRCDLTSREGVDTVRKLNGVLVWNNQPRGILVTTAKSYTPGADRCRNRRVPVVGYGC